MYLTGVGIHIGDQPNSQIFSFKWEKGTFTMGGGAMVNESQAVETVILKRNSRIHSKPSTDRSGR